MTTRGRTAGEPPVGRLPLGRVIVLAALILSCVSGCVVIGRDGSADDPVQEGEQVDEGADRGGRPGAPSADPLVAAFDHRVDYEVTGTTSCPVRAIAFTDESEGDPTGWHWEFDDGSTSTEQDPVIDREVHEATLTVTRGEESDSVTEEISISVC